MEYTTFGNTQRRISRIGFGGATAGLTNYTGLFNPHDVSEREELLKAMRLAYELGINYFDTAASYGNGVSEEIFGEGLSGIKPQSIFLATKASVGDGENTRRSLERSLTHLKREWIDLIQIHSSFLSQEDVQTIFMPGGMLQALEKAKEEGLVKHIGFTAECQNRALFDLIDSKRFASMQMQYNLLFQHPSDFSWNSGCIFEAEKQGMGIAVMRTATSGIFQRWVQQVNPQNTFDYTPALIQMVLSNPMVDVALIGMRTCDIVEKNVAIVNDISGRITLSELHDRYVH